MKIVKTKVYKFDELSEEAKQKAVEQLQDINVDYGWWELIYEDAENIGFRISEFDLGRGSYCKGVFVEDAETTARAILQQHGETCETYQDAKNYLKEQLDSVFLHDLQEDYQIILQKEYEYLASEEAIIETIKINEYEFTEDGKLFRQT